MIGSDAYYLHTTKIKLKFRDTNPTPTESKIINDLISSVGYEATINETLIRIDKIKDILETAKSTHEVAERIKYMIGEK